MRTIHQRLLARAAMLLLLAMLPTAAAWADEAVTLQDDGYGTMYVNMPMTGTSTLTISDATVTTFKVYDDGGASGNYSNNCSGTLVLTAPDGYMLQLSGNITSENNYDKLTVYDGNSTSGSKLIDGMSSRIRAAIPAVISSGQSMTLYFYSDGSTNYPGLDLTVTLIDTTTDYNVTVGSASGGIISSDKSKAKVGDTVTLTASAESGCVLSDLSVVDAGGNAVTVTDMLWYTDKSTATFTMPPSAVTVTPKFTNGKGTAAGLYVNMPATGTKTVTIPSGYESFKVYDDGGASGNYSNNSSGILVLTAPEGYVLQLSGSIILDKFDKLTVYDGSTASDTKLLNAVTSPTSGTRTAITTVVSNGQSMTLYFKSDYSTSYDGLDLTVTVTTLTEVSLADAADNSSTISTARGRAANVILSGRTLTRDGYWNTLCLPFDVTAEQIAVNTHPLYGATIKTLSNSASGTRLSDDGELTLVFTKATAIEAGKPYIVMWATTGDNITAPVFSGVTISSTEPQELTSSDGRVKFVGQYSPFAITEDNISAILYVATGNKIGYAKSARTLKSCRAHFYVASDGSAQAARSIRFDFGDGETASISLVPTIEPGTTDWYTIDGMRLGSEPTAKGIYIVNGRKVIK